MAERALRYPKELVHRYGAKAGILLYVADKLPHIPQARMVVTEPEESADAFLSRAHSAQIGFPRLYRSSAIVELDGYEGDFPTEVVYDRGSSWRAVVDVATSPRRLKADGSHQDLPDRINVIAAEKSPSIYSGTYIKHPNNEGEYLTMVVDHHTGYNYRYTPQRGLHRLFGSYALPSFDQNAEAELEEIFTWHDEIASLSEMDKNWSYQIEFGVDPPMLYQVRPFQPIKKAEFQLEPPDEFDQMLGLTPTVIGITPQEGVEVQVVQFVNRFVPGDESLLDISAPKVLVGDLRSAKRSREFRLGPICVNLFGNADGFLAHEDIKSVRPAMVTGLHSDRSENRFPLHHGEFVNIVSDGRNMQIREN